MMGILKGKIGSGEFNGVEEKVMTFSRLVLLTSLSFPNSPSLSELEPNFMVQLKSCQS